MIDNYSQKPVKVINDELAGPYIKLSADLIDAVCAILQANNVRYWVEHQTISINGKPFVGVINLDLKSDPQQVQKLLDNAA